MRESPCFGALAHKNRGIREVSAFLRSSCWDVVSLEWVCLSPTDVILWEIEGGHLIHHLRWSPFPHWGRLMETLSSQQTDNTLKSIVIESLLQWEKGDRVSGG